MFLNNLVINLQKITCLMKEKITWYSLPLIKIWYLKKITSEYSWHKNHKIQLWYTVQKLAESYRKMILEY